MTPIHIIVTAAPKNDLTSDSARVYREIHVTKLPWLVSMMADCGEDAANQGLTILNTETFNDLGSFLDAWAKVIDRPTFKEF